MENKTIAKLLQKTFAEYRAKIEGANHYYDIGYVQYHDIRDDISTFTLNDCTTVDEIMTFLSSDTNLGETSVTSVVRSGNDQHPIYVYKSDITEYEPDHPYSLVETLLEHIETRLVNKKKV